MIAVGPPGLDNAVLPLLLLWAKVQWSIAAPVQKMLYTTPMKIRIRIRVYAGHRGFFACLNHES